MPSPFPPDYLTRCERLFLAFALVNISGEGTGPKAQAASSLSRKLGVESEFDAELLALREHFRIRLALK